MSELTVLYEVGNSEELLTTVQLSGLMRDNNQTVGYLEAWAGVNNPSSSRDIPRCDVVTIERVFVPKLPTLRRKGIASTMLRQFFNAIHDPNILNAKRAVGDIENPAMIHLLDAVAGPALTLSDSPCSKRTVTPQEGIDLLAQRHAELNRLEENNVPINGFTLGLFASIELDMLDMNNWDQAHFVAGSHLIPNRQS